MRNTLRQWLDNLYRDMVRTEGCSREMAAMAETLAHQGEQATAQALWSASRSYQVRAITYRAQIAALTDCHTDLLSEPSSEKGSMY